MRLAFIRFFSCFLMLCLCLTVFIPGNTALAEYDTSKADALNELGLFNGSDKGYELDRAATRNESAVMLIRLMGREDKAKVQFSSGALTCPFSDVPDWAKAQVTWLYEGSYLNGTSKSAYSGSATITAQQYAALVLRCLGYTETEGDFIYDNALNFAASIGLLSDTQISQYKTQFLRGDMVDMSYNALYLKMNGSKLTLFEKLTSDGVFKKKNVPAAPTLKVSLSLKYQGGGADDKWYVEPATACPPVYTDLDGDGKGEIVYSSNSLFSLDAATGKTEWRIRAGSDKSSDYGKTKSFGYTSAGLFVIDIDGDGSSEIITSFSNGDTASSCVAVYDSKGYFKKGWPLRTKAMVKALKVADLEGDGEYEIIVGLGTGDTSESLYVYEPDGSLREGWPRPAGNSIYADGIAAEDLNGDGVKEIILPVDTEQLCAFEADGNEAAAGNEEYGGLSWNGIPLCEGSEYEEKCVDWAKNHGGIVWATADGMLGDVREERNCYMGTIGGVSAADLDGDGTEELAVTGMIVDGAKVMRGDTSTFKNCIRYFTVFILKLDRSRYTNTALGYDWREAPVDNGNALLMNPYILPYTDSAPVTEDIDEDGSKEIIYASCDGKVHCFNLDKTEHGAWPYSLVSRSDSVTEYATKPVCYDLNGDGTKEVIFASYTENEQMAERGKIYVLDCMGKALCVLTLPTKWGSGDYAPNGCRAQPLVTDVDGDGKAEIVITSLFSGIMVYDVNLG